MSDQDTDLDDFNYLDDLEDLERPAPWWVRALKRIMLATLILVTILACFIAYLAWDISRYDEVNSPPVFDGVMDETPIPQARAQTIDLLLEIYQALEDQAGIGTWEPITYYYQVKRARLTCSPTGEGTNEEYRLATAPSATTIEHATAIVEQVAGPHGFVRREDNKNVFVRPSDGAQIWFDGGRADYTVVNITTGCHPGTIYQDWPTGTENIPGYLRTLGREDQLWQETWPAHEPTRPTPSPPPDWTPPTPTTTSARGRASDHDGELMMAGYSRTDADRS